MHHRIHAHAHHPFVAFSSVVAALVFMAMTFALPAEAAVKTYTHASHGYSFSRPSTWTVKKGSTNVMMTPAASQRSALQAQGVSYSLSAASLNADSAVFTSSLQASLRSGWSAFAKAYGKAMGKKQGVTSVTTKGYTKSGWSASVITFSKRVNGAMTYWRYVVMSKDRSTVFVVHEKWTKRTGSPFAADVASIVKSFRQASLPSVSWTFDGSTWTANATPPVCPTPALAAPVDLTLASHVLYPGQVRGGDFKPHGGFRFDGQAATSITVRAPMDMRVVRGSRYIESGTVQYLFDLEAPCGIRVRFDHLHTLSSTFAALADTLPAAEPDNTTTTNFSSPITVKAGDVIATAVGFPDIGNVSVDFGVYDLRQRNAAAADATWRTEYENEAESAWYGVCWFDYLSAADEATVRALEPGDGQMGATSAYCGT